jgi:hypothetical protein
MRCDVIPPELSASTIYIRTFAQLDTRIDAQYTLFNKGRPRYDKLTSKNITIDS